MLLAPNGGADVRSIPADELLPPSVLEVPRRGSTVQSSTPTSGEPLSFWQLSDIADARGFGILLGWQRCLRDGVAPRPVPTREGRQNAAKVAKGELLVDINPPDKVSKLHWCELDLFILVVRTGDA